MRKQFDVVDTSHIIALLDEAAGPGRGGSNAVVPNAAVQRQGNGLPEPPFSDEKLRPLSKEQLQELYDKYRKSNPKEAEKVKKWQKSMGFRGSSVKRNQGKKFLKKGAEEGAQEAGEKAAKGAGKKLFKRAAGKAGRAVKVLAPIFFIYDWSDGGFGHAVNEALWPLSELWTDDEEPANAQ